MNEVEVKAKISNKETLISKLTSLGCEFSEPKKQDDSVYYQKDADLNNLGPNPTIMRIRVQNGVNTLTLKQPQSNDLDCLELETKFENVDQMHQILELIGYLKKVRIVKTRRKSKYNDIEICLDEVEDLGNFIELEKMTPPEESKIVQDELFTFLESLGVLREDKVELGYDQLMRAKKDIR